MRIDSLSFWKHDESIFGDSVLAVVVVRVSNGVVLMGRFQIATMFCVGKGEGEIDDEGYRKKNDDAVIRLSRKKQIYEFKKYC